ncbi:RRXRR domain-containing protein [Nostoc sp.]|uniref:RRXRR domain-containing protein n=2 Tax=Nostoc TaxID=1177 RepID=UPI002FF72CB7
MFVPVVDQNNRPLMPTTPSRAKRWMKSGKATPFFKKGVFCVRLNQEPSNRNTQPIAVGIDRMAVSVRDLLLNLRCIHI